jgi:hypothetical protein
LVSPPAVDGGKARIADEGVVKADACGFEFRGGEVTSANREIGSDIADDVDELECLAEEAGLLEAFG